MRHHFLIYLLEKGLEERLLKERVSRCYERQTASIYINAAWDKLRNKVGFNRQPEKQNKPLEDA
jgi:hypothetical protein